MLCAQYGLNFVRFGEDAAREFFQLAHRIHDVSSQSASIGVS
jgi:hypothetical protein